MTDQSSFATPGELEAACENLWDSLINGVNFFPSFIEDFLQWCVDNSLSLFIIGLFIVMIAFHFLVVLISWFTDQSR